MGSINMTNIKTTTSQNNLNFKRIKNNKNIYPFISICFMICTLLVIVFFHMEERRLGYALFYESKSYKNAIQTKRQKEIQFKQAIRPQLVESLASKRLTLQPVREDQIIHLTQSQND